MVKIIYRFSINFLTLLKFVAFRNKFKHHRIMKFFRTFLAALLAVVVGSFVMGFLWILVFIGIAGSMESTTVVQPESVLVINIDEQISDSPEINPLNSFDFQNMTAVRHMSLYSALRAIDAAADDSRIKGICIRLNGQGSADITTLEELRDNIEQFKASGKFVVAYNETYSQFGYYLSSVADRVYLQPEGTLMWNGITFNIAFYKGLLDKLDIEAEVFRPTACKYKSAVEPYILTRMSDANRQQMSELAESIWGTVTGAVSRSRSIPVEKLNALADNLSALDPEKALEAGLVDGLIYEDQLNDVYAEYGVEPGHNGEYNTVTLGEYAAQAGADLSNVSADRIAIVYAEGQILDGNGEYDAIYGNTMAARIRSVRLDDKVKAVVLRVNSPGGSALASDVIWRELELLRAEKPVVVSMGGYAASGGYYISAPADVIVADNMTLTGSIGVYGMYMNIGKALKNKLGITVDGVKTNTSADFGNTTRPITATERAAIMRSVDNVYETFTGLVAKGRNLPLEKVLELAGGRVWSGSEAVELGLADANGGLKAAISVAADKAALGDNYRIVEVTEMPMGLMSLFTSLNAQVRERAVRSEMGILYDHYKSIREALRLDGVLAYCPYYIRFE